MTRTRRKTRARRAARAPALWAAAAALAGLALPAPAEAGEPHLRVIAQSAPVRSGPGADYREIAAAERGEVYPVLRRGTRGYWLEIELADGTSGWIFGDLVFPFEVDAEPGEPGFFSRAGDAFRGAVLGPPEAPEARVGLAATGGVIGGEGVFFLRPAVFLDPHFALEGFAGARPGAQDDLWFAGVGGAIRLAPTAALGPYVYAGAGAGHSRPQADHFTEDPQTLGAVATGAGVETTLVRRITVRLDYRNWTLFDADEASNAQEFSGGLAIFF